MTEWLIEGLIDWFVRCLNEWLTECSRDRGRVCIGTNVSHHECGCERERARDCERDRDRETLEANNGRVMSVSHRIHIWIIVLIPTNTDFVFEDIHIACFIYTRRLVCTFLPSDKRNMENHEI